jgi:hypothetical protein
MVGSTVSHLAGPRARRLISVLGVGMTSVTYLCGDHLTSTVETNDNNANLSQLYYPYGTSGARRSGSLTPYRYTGQRWERRHRAVLLQRPVV